MRKCIARSALIARSSLIAHSALTARSAMIVAVAVLGGVAALPAVAADQEPINSPPSAQDWQTLAKLPDWSGVWTPVVTDQVAQEKSNPPPWKPQIAKQIEHMYA